MLRSRGGGRAAGDGAGQLMKMDHTGDERLAVRRAPAAHGGEETLDRRDEGIAQGHTPAAGHERGSVGRQLDPPRD
jgi:hypothetical protein